MWSELAVHATLEIDFAKTCFGGGFDEFSSAESDLRCSVVCGQGNPSGIDSPQPAVTDQVLNFESLGIAPQQRITGT